MFRNVSYGRTDWIQYVDRMNRHAVRSLIQQGTQTFL